MLSTKARGETELHARHGLAYKLYKYCTTLFSRRTTLAVGKLADRLQLVLKRRSFLEDEQWTSNRDGKPGRASRPPDARAPPRQCAGRQRLPALLTPCE